MASKSDEMNVYFRCTINFNLYSMCARKELIDLKLWRECRARPAEKHAYEAENNAFNA